MATIKLLKPKRDNVRTDRKKKYQAIYQDKRWKYLRSAKLRSNPLCERCEAERNVTPADEVHHVIPFDWGRDAKEIESLAFDYENLLSVCLKCHDNLHEEILKNNLKIIWLNKGVNKY